MGTIPASRACAESIAILHTLHKVPLPPSRQQPKDSPPWRPEDYSLPFEKELKLCEVLAFLASLEEDQNHIPAVSIQQGPLGEGTEASLIVLVAVNQSKPGDGTQQLRSAQAGLEGIFHAMSQVTLVSNTEENIFRTIVTVCSLRITQRLRLSKLSRNEKKSFDVILQSATSALNEREEPFTRVCKALQESIRDWTQHQTNEELAVVVQDALELSRVPGLQRILDSIRNNLMDPGERRAIVNVVQKVGRYREAARFLYRIAKKYSAARRLRFRGVSLPPGSFTNLRGAIRDPPPSLSSALQGASLYSGQFSKLPFLWHLLALNEETANDKFLNCLRMRRHPKVHAEVQLLHYYETSRPSPPLRVLCSSKDACFLCHAAVTLHGKLHMNRSHGRLYPGWALPGGLEDLEGRLKVYLDGFIHQSVSAMVTRRQRVLYPDPLESTTGSLVLSTTTVAEQGESDEGVVLGQGDKTDVVHFVDEILEIATAPEACAPSTAPKLSTEDSEPNIIPSLLKQPPSDIAVSDGDPPTSTVSSNPTATILSDSGGTKGDTAQTGLDPAASIHSSEDISSRPAPSSPPSPKDTTPASPPQASVPSTASDITTPTASISPKQHSNLIVLQKGQPLSISITPSSQPTIYEAWPIRLHLEWEYHHCKHSSTSSKAFHIEWVSDKEFEALKQHQGQRGKVKIIDADALSECSVTHDDLGRLYLYARGTIMKVCCLPL